MRFYGTAGHVKLTGDLGVVTSLQQQFGNLFFTRTQLDRLLAHSQILPSLRLPADQAIQTRSPGTPDLKYFY